MTLYAMTSPQGTACSETALCETHYTPDWRKRAELETTQFPDYDRGVKWEDCTGNESLECIVCGTTSYDPPAGKDS